MPIPVTEGSKSSPFEKQCYKDRVEDCTKDESYEDDYFQNHSKDEITTFLLIRFVSHGHARGILKMFRNDDS